MSTTNNELSAEEQFWTLVEVSQLSDRAKEALQNYIEADRKQYAEYVIGIDEPEELKRNLAIVHDNGAINRNRLRAEQRQRAANYPKRGQE